MKSFIVFLLFLLHAHSAFKISHNSNEIHHLNLLNDIEGGNPHGNNGTISLIEAAGYPAETHTVTTEDGYILQMHRIPYSKKVQSDAKLRNISKPVVFLQHGLLGSSEKWVLSWSKPTESLGFILSDEGYDVWLGNYRGNRYSMQHRTLDPEEMEYWDFCWDEMGKFDLPAMINKVLETTREEQLVYIGHSMGATGFLAMAASKPQMQSKIVQANLLAPAAFMEHIRSPVRIIAPYANEIKEILDMLGIGRFPPKPFSNHNSGDMEKTTSRIDDEFCDPSITGLIFGFDREQCNKTLMEWASTSSSSVRAIIHYGQLITSGLFCKYDFGETKNEQIYGQKSPPEYEIKAIKCPVVTYWGDNDWLVEPTDLFKLTSELSNLIESYRVPWDKWNHQDHVTGIDADVIVYPELLRNIKLGRVFNN